MVDQWATRAVLDQDIFLGLFQGQAQTLARLISATTCYMLQFKLKRLIRAAALVFRRALEERFSLGSLLF
jgi:hypothetical protein